jgi:hypothetical protein
MEGYNLPPIVESMTICFAKMVILSSLKVKTENVPAIICAGADNLYPFN